MRNYSQCIHIFSQEESFEAGAIELLRKSHEGDKVVMRITIFGECVDDSEYERNVEFLERTTVELYGAKAPLVSYVTQPLLDGGKYVAEVQVIGVDVDHREMDGLRYLIMESDDMRRLVVCGVRGSVRDSIRKQSDDLFAKLTKLFALEGFEISDIFRQWNYIPQITAVDSSDYQHYQAFNDSRTEFYRLADWSTKGYPAATGIGMDCGAVTVDLIAVKPLNDKMKILPVDNDLQLAAHVYSQEVLIGAECDKIEGRSTPKFERAKALGNKEEGYILFISGTAAIRGEDSMDSDDAATQTIQTMENIEHLVSDHTCNKYGIEISSKEREIHSARAYVKLAKDTADIKRVTEARWSDTSVVYLLADVCREELLIEIEAITNIPF
ncbi:MAG: hypothetical protein SNG02_02150 [Rikenellaceae bacterium]